MAKPSLWQRIKSKFQKKKPLFTEVKVKSHQTVKQARIKIAQQIMKARITVKRLRNRDKRKIPIFLLTFDEIEAMLRDIPIALPSRKDEENQP